VVQVAQAVAVTVQILELQHQTVQPTWVAVVVVPLTTMLLLARAVLAS
jgi:hypothetical protein